jgi:hypothetical protein
MKLEGLQLFAIVPWLSIYPNFPPAVDIFAPAILVLDMVLMWHIRKNNFNYYVESFDFVKSAADP